MRRLFAIAALITPTTSVPMAAENTLLDAAERGDRAAVTRLLAKGANPNTPGPTAPPRSCAAANGDVELVRAHQGGANVKPNQFGTSALTEAAIIGSAPIIDRCSRPAPIPTRRILKAKPLMAVARSGKVDAAKRLLEAGADINAKENFGGQTALMWAAAQSQAEMVKLLAARARTSTRAA